jgi:hypothetical protein
MVARGVRAIASHPGSATIPNPHPGRGARSLVPTSHASELSANASLLSLVARQVSPAASRATQRSRQARTIHRAIRGIAVSAKIRKGRWQFRETKGMQVCRISSVEIKGQPPV